MEMKESIVHAVARRDPAKGQAEASRLERSRRRLIHYSTKPLTAIRSVAQVPAISDPMLGDKPRGLWVSAEGTDSDDGWKWWCEGEGYCLPSLAVATEIVLRPDARILWVSGARALDAFHREFSSAVKLGPTYSRVAIDWPRVAQLHQGIVIAPYVWTRRLHGVVRWYYSWDCASGCIWDAAAIETLLPVADGALERQDGSLNTNGHEPKNPSPDTLEGER